MGAIVCATRGGQGSRAVRIAAIDRAISSAEPLVFLFVVGKGQTDDLDPELHDAYVREAYWVGQALLEIARNHARNAGVDAKVEIREGDLLQAILASVDEHDASVIMLGAPRNTSANVFGDDAIEQFALELMSRTEASVDVVRP